MTADMLSMPTLPEKPLSSFQYDKSGSFSSDPSSKTELPGSSVGDKTENFLTTLKEVSRDRNPSEESRQLASHPGPLSGNTALHPENEQEIDLESTGGETLMDITTLLEELGLNGSPGERMVLPGAELTKENMSQPGSVELANWAKGIFQGQENAISVNGAMAGEGAGGEKSVEILSAMTRSEMETENVLKAPGSIKAVENSQIPLQLENPEKTDAAKLNLDIRTAVEANETAKDTEPVSKLINDALVEKENPLKGDSPSGDDAGSKVVKIEAGTHDSGQLTSQSQTFEKANETVSLPRETAAGQRELRTQTMEQMVRRAVIQVRDGHHEARIDLKPDFLGHVRMQVITENQLITVKILTEFGFVKDMIENNLQQLKADLQHQGLDVDKLEVSVSRDANGYKHQQENTEHARVHREDKSSDPGNAREGQEKQTDRSARSAEGLLTVDYFA